MSIKFVSKLIVYLFVKKFINNDILLTNTYPSVTMHQ